ncbi:MAG: zinc ribbon domain-containing protein [Ruminococcus sp.]|nr:zinc ribbon domain-containing protein [Ruminococcus sp.]
MAQRYCQACGNALGDNETFCAACGAPNDVPAAAAAAPSAAPQAVPTAKKSGGAAAALAGKKNIIIIAGAALVVIIVAIVVILNLTKYQTIDAKELVRVEFKGMDGKGTATAVLNTDHKEYNEETDKTETVKGSDFLVQSEDDDYKDRLLEAYSKAGSKKEAKEMQEVIIDTKKDGELRNISFELSDEKDLKNGDTVTVTVEFDEDEFKNAGIKLENTEFEIEVEGLNDVKSIDVFDYCEVKFDGFDGFGSYSVETKADMPDELKDYVSFGRADYNNNLKNGDKVKVEAYVYGNYTADEDGEEVYLKTKENNYYDYGYKKGENLTKEFEVSGLKELAEYDPMADVKVEFSGVGPYKINKINKDAVTAEIADQLSFDYEWSKEYNVGDSVQIKVYPYSGLKDLGYKLKGSADSDGYYIYTITLTEDMVPVLITKKEDVGDLNAASEKYFTDKLDEIKKDNTRYIGDVTLAEDPKSWSDFELEKTYLVVNNDISSDDYDENVKLARVYKATVTDKKNKKYEVHVLLYGYNLIKSNGELSLTRDYVTYATARKKLGDFNKYFEDDYHFKKDTYKMIAVG